MQAFAERPQSSLGKNVRAAKFKATNQDEGLSESGARNDVEDIHDEM